MTATSVSRWDGLDAPAVAERLGLPHVELLAEVDSTNDVAHERAGQGAPAGSLVVADAQRAGRGRLGRSWSSGAGRGVWCTLVERPADRSALDVLSIRVGMAIARRLDGVAGELVGVKWPNDLVLRAGKVGGVLAEARWDGPVLTWVAIGVGINVIPPDGLEGAVGLPDGTRRVDVLAAIVHGVREAASRRGHLDDHELNAFRERDILRGRRLASPGAGVANGITATGALIIRGASGAEHYRAGTVHDADASTSGGDT